MRILLITAAAASLASVAGATPTMHRHHAAMPSQSGSAAVRDLNEKSLQQASAGTTMAPPAAPAAMPDANSPAMAPPAASGAPMSNDMATPPATPAPQ